MNHAALGLESGAVTLIDYDVRWALQFPRNRESYMHGKSDFVTGVLATCGSK